MHQHLDSSSNSSNESPPSQPGSSSTNNVMTSSTSSSEEVSLETNLSPISCGPCRKAHKRCDRMFPSCSKCMQRGVDCFYNEPKKRGKASDTYRSKKRVKQDGIELKQIVNYYYSYMSGGYPIIAKAKLEFFIDEYLSQIENSDEFTIEKNQFIGSEQELHAIYAFFLSVKSIYYQLNGNLQTASEAIVFCEEFLGKLLTKSMHFYIYAACQMVAVYYSGAGDLSKVRFYDTMVNYYLNGNEKSSFDKYEENMRKRMTCLTKASTDFLDEFAGFLKKMPSFFENSVAKKLQDLLLPGTLEYLQVAPKTLEGYAFFKKVTEFTYRVMGQYHDDSLRDVKDCQTEDFAKYEQMFKTIMYCGFHLYYLNALPMITPQLEEIALKITIASESEYFRYTIPEVIVSIKGAAQTHLDICKLIESGKRVNNSLLQVSDGKILSLDYYSILEKDLNALTSLQKRYPVRVNGLCEDLMNNMGNILRAHNEGLIRLSQQLIEDNDLEPIANHEHCTCDSNSDQSNDLTRTDCQDNTCNEGSEKWNSLVHYLEAIDNEFVNGESATDFVPDMDLDQFLI